MVDRKKEKDVSMNKTKDEKQKYSDECEERANNLKQWMIYNWPHKKERPLTEKDFRDMDSDIGFILGMMLCGQKKIKKLSKVEI